MYSKIIKALIMGVFLLSNITWAAQVQTAYELRLCMGSGKYDCFDGDWYYATEKDKSHTWANALDLQNKGGIGANLYMAYRTGVMYNYIDIDNKKDYRAITNIIIVDFGSDATIQDTIYKNNIMYIRLPVNSEDGYKNYPLNRNKYTSYHHLHMYYTHDYIDGKAVTEIRASSNETQNSSISGFEIVKNEKNKNANINWSSNSYYNYVHIKREIIPNAPSYSIEPYVKSSVTYNPLGISFKDALNFGTPKYSSDIQSFKIGNKFEDGKWADIDNYLIPGNYDAYFKLEAGTTYPIYVKGPLTFTVKKITSTDIQNSYFKLNSTSLYSGQKLDIEWKNPCVHKNNYTGAAPTNATYKYKLSSSNAYTTFNLSSQKFSTPGKYYLTASQPGNAYCEDINIGPFEFNVVQSQLIIKKNNGEADVIIEKDVDEPINYTLPTSLTWTGYTFKGWSRSVPATMPAGVTIIEARWTINKHTLTVDPNAGSDNVYKTKTSNCTDEGNTSCYSNSFKKTTQSVSYNTNLSSYRPSTLYRIGYTFNDWSSSETTMPDKNLTLTAQWRINKYTMTFNTDGGSSIASITANYNASITKPANPTRTGFAFKGWNPEIPSTMPAGNKTYKAIWDTLSYTITFKDGYTSTPIKTENTKYLRPLSNLTYPQNPTRTGYTFTGWDIPTLPSTMPANNIVVTAKWNINKFQVTFPSKYMEAIAPQGFTGGKLDYNTTIKLKFKDEYKYLGTVIKNGSQFTDQSGIYTISSVTEGAEITIDEEKVYENYGSILIKHDHSIAIIGYNSPETREIAKPIEVDSITYAKSFTKNVTESIMFPFEMDLRYIHGGIFCKFTGYDKEQNVVRMLFMRTKLAANTPYLIVPTSKNLTFNLSKGQKVAIQTSDIHSVREGDWEFRGTYDFTDWAKLTDEVGKAYIFNANGEGDGIKGQFNRVNENNTLEPLRAYLIYNPIQQVKRSEAAFAAAANSISTFSLPEVIDVRIESENGGTTAIGHINMRTGEFKIERWFDLNGKLLNEKPTTNGIYYNNGKKVIVK